MTKVQEYALKILHDHGCDEYTYGMTDGETIIEDLKEAYPAGMEFPYIEVTNAIISISRRKPLERAPYHMVYDCDSGGFIDAINCLSIEEAMETAFETLIQWMDEGICDGTVLEQVDRYNDMIEHDRVWVEKYNPATDEYDECWYPSDDDLDNIGWRKIKYPNEEE